MSENYKFVQNKECEFFPCHKGADEATFNCLFCFCPLYALGKDCGGDFTYTATGIKDCSNCLIPHSPQGYDYIMSKMDEVMEIARKKD